MVNAFDSQILNLTKVIDQTDSNQLDECCNLEHRFKILDRSCQVFKRWH